MPGSWQGIQWTNSFDEIDSYISNQTRVFHYEYVQGEKILRRGTSKYLPSAKGGSQELKIIPITS